MEAFIEILQWINNNIIWGPPTLILLVGTGIFLTIRLGLIQVFRLPLAFKLIFKAQNRGSGEITSFAALCTALAATIGTGNIVGVATAVKTGGPGALFWLMVAAFFGMATKYTEGVLAIKYRKIDENGVVSGGPMYYITQGLGEKFRPLAIFFAISAVAAALLGIGTMTQVNSITDSIYTVTEIPKWISALIVSVLVTLVVIGGLKSISKVTSKIVPFMAILYILICLVILIVNFDKIPATVSLIWESAFHPVAATGGFLGATVAMAIQYGFARGCFSNEAGLGSAPIASAAAKTNSPGEQGLISMTGTFIDSIIICTLTGLTLVITGLWSGGPTGELEGAAMTQAAFATVLSSWGPILLMICLALFAFTTILGWNYYGERCTVFLFGNKGILPYRILFIISVFMGGFLTLDFIWLIADLANGLMAIPNLVALLLLSGVVARETRKYQKERKKLNPLE